MTTAPTTITLPTSNLAAAVTQLDWAIREQLITALRAADAAEIADNDAAILATIRDLLAYEDPDGVAIGVVFSTEEYSDGHYLTDTGDVLYPDGSTGSLDFAPIADTFTAQFGSHGENLRLAVDLRSNTLNVGDNAQTIHEIFSVAVPHASRPPAPEPATPTAQGATVPRGIPRTAADLAVSTTTPVAVVVGETVICPECKFPGVTEVDAGIRLNTLYFQPSEGVRAVIADPLWETESFQCSNPGCAITLDVDFTIQGWDS